MKNSVLFKSLIDIFFVFHIIGFIAMLLKFPMGFIDVENIAKPQLLDWVFLAINTICYLIFLKGLYFLRKLARAFLSQKYFADSIAVNMKISGTHFISAGLISVLTLWSGKLLNLNLEPVYRSFVITPVFLIIVGLFFVIQSKTLLLAIRLKSENDLTI